MSAPAVRDATRVIAYKRIRRRPTNGFTSDELEQHTGLSHQTISARLSELEDAGLVRRNYRMTRVTRQGGDANPYLIVDSKRARRRASRILGV